jgi:hypothetical protein
MFIKILYKTPSILAKYVEVAAIIGYTYITPMMFTIYAGIATIAAFLLPHLAFPKFSFPLN